MAARPYFLAYACQPETLLPGLCMHATVPRSSAAKAQMCGPSTLPDLLHLHSTPCLPACLPQKPGMPHVVWWWPSCVYVALVALMAVAAVLL